MPMHRTNLDELQVGNKTVRILEADITALPVDAIVNAANQQLLAGGGVCGAIHAAAGAQLQRECHAVAPCPTGQARITPGCKLPAKYVIHAVGPVWMGGESGEAEQLASAYRSSLELAAQHQVRNIAFPAISTGIFGFPLEPATQIALNTVVKWLQEHPDYPEEVIFVTRSQTTAAYLAALQIFPLE